MSEESKYSEAWSIFSFLNLIAIMSIALPEKVLSDVEDNIRQGKTMLDSLNLAAKQYLAISKGKPLEPKQQTADNSNVIQFPRK